jgi:hypothetical protein
VDHVDEDIDKDYDDIDNGYVESKTVEKNKKKNKKAEPLPCSHSQFVGLLQDLLACVSFLVQVCGPTKRG